MCQNKAKSHKEILTLADMCLVKRFLSSQKYLVIFENSLFVYLALAITMIGLFSYVYSGHKAMLTIYEKARTSHLLSVEALLLSEENYHTQLELYEVFSIPDQKRFDAFYQHEKMFFDQLDKTHKAFFENREDVPSEIMMRLEALKKASPLLQNHWHKFLYSIKRKKSLQEQLRLLEEAELVFDEEKFNEKIKDIVKLQLVEVEHADKLAQNITQRNSIITMLGILITFVLTCAVILLHRGALRGKINELQLVQAGKLASLGQLSAGMAHELNNPLMFIGGYNSRIRAALKKENLSADSSVWEYLDEVESGVARISAIVKHFRDFSRLSKNELKPVSINQIVTRSFVLFEEQLRQREIFVELLLSKEDPLIMADAIRIEQVLLNLISNARDALSAKKDSGLKRIMVLTQATDDSVVLRFSDTGIGITKENLSRIFDPFFTTKAVGLGTGLGLSISAGIIRDHHAKLEVESELGEGTHFTIRFQK